MKTFVDMKTPWQILLFVLLVLAWPVLPPAAQEAPGPESAVPEPPSAAESPAPEPPSDEPPSDDMDDVAGDTDDVAGDTGDDSAPAASRSTVVVGRIDGEIGLAESAYVKRLVEEGERQGAATLIIELNTFGGRIDAAVAIRDALMDTEMHTAVFINRRAISAGALISFSCDSIAMARGGTIGAATPVTQSAGEIAQPVAEKYVSYFREEMRTTAETNGRDGDIAEAMVDAEKEVKTASGEVISAEGKLLTLNTRTALEHGMADVEAEDLDDALRKLGLEGAQLDVTPTWSESLVAFLTSPAVASLLGLAMMILAYLEYQSPGFGVFGGGAILCFLILYFGHYMVNLAGWEELILFVVGVALLLAELFLTPGFGLLGFAGMTSILASFVMLLMAGDWSDVRLSNPFTADAILQVVLTGFVAVLAFILMVRYLPRENPAFGGRIILQTNLGVDAGYESHERQEESLVGMQGRTLTPLRPSGKALIAGKRRNVETEGDFVESDKDVEVMRHAGGRIVVRAV